MLRLSPLRRAAAVAAHLGTLAALCAPLARAGGPWPGVACGGEACPRAADAEEDASLLQLASRANGVGHGGAGLGGDDACLADSLPDYKSLPGVTLMTLNQAKPCLDEVRGPAFAAKETVHALARYFANFYAFARIAADPPAANYTFAPEYADAGLGVFGGDGGGAPAELSKVDLINGLERLAEGIPDDNTTVPLAAWVAPVNDLFTAVRDAHVSWQNGPCQPATVLSSMFTLALISEEGGLVQLDVSAAPGDIQLDGQSTPVVVVGASTPGGSASVVQSIGGSAPLTWLQTTILESPAFPLSYKSVGARMNALIAKIRSGVSWELGSLGALDSFQGDPIAVELKDKAGSVSQTTWTWHILSTHRRAAPACATFACAVASQEPSLRDPGEYASKIGTALSLLRGGWHDPVPAPAHEPLRQAPEPAAEPEPAKKSAAPEASSGVSEKMPADVFAWLLEPTDTTDTYGFLAFRKGDDGAEHGVFKYTTFLLSAAYGVPAPAGYDLLTDSGSDVRTLDMMRAKWSAFAAEAQRRGVTRLIVDGVGNGGGLTSLAWQFVQFMLPDLPFVDTCGMVSRPIPKAYKLWEAVNLVPVYEFMTLEGLQQARFAQFGKDPAALQSVVSNTQALLGVAHSLNLLDKSEETGLIKQLKEAHEDAKSPDTAWTGFVKFFNALHGLGNTENPFSNPSTVMIEAYRHPSLEIRGGDNRSFTTKMMDCPAGSPGNLTNPFDDIVIVSDGLCGSSCYLATGTTWAVAKKFGKRKVRFATFGGVGGSIADAKKTLSATSFPGGNVMRNGAEAVVKPVLRGLLVQTLVANFIGSNATVHGLTAAFAEMVSLVPYYSNSLPGFTQSQVYQPSFGPDAPPAEYVFVPTDLYIPYWFKSVSGTSPREWDVSQLEMMYASAAQAFSK